MTGAIVITWGAPVRGREAKGMEVFGHAIERFEGLAKEGRIHGHREYFAVTGNTGRVGGFMLIEGDLQELVRLQGEEEQIVLQQKASAIVENFSVQIFAGGSDRAVQERMTSYVETLQGLGVM
jgi:hypothetical protein